MKTETLHTSGRYTANHVTGHHPRLVVASVRGSRAVMMRPDHPQFAEYIEAFRESLDAVESDALCRALLS